MRKINFFLISSIIFGLIFVTLIKNETRKIEKDLSILKASIKALELDLHETTLDFQFLSSPGNIKELSDFYLSPDFTSYKKRQIEKTLVISDIKLSMLKNQNKKFAHKRVNPKKNSFDDNSSKNKELKKPKDNSKRVKNWALTQLIKTFIGIPPIPIK